MRTALREAPSWRAGRNRLAEMVGLHGPAAVSPSAEHVCETVCKRAQELIGADGGCVSFFDPVTDRMSMPVCTGVLRPLEGLHFPVDESVSGTAMRLGRSLIDNELSGSKTGTTARTVAPDLERAVSVPLGFSDRILGTLSLVRVRGGGRFDEADVRLLEGYAVPVSFALISTELGDEARASAEDEARLRRENEAFIADLRRLHLAEIAISSDLELETVLDRVVGTAVALTCAQRGALGLLTPAGDRFERFVTAGEVVPDPHSNGDLEGHRDLIQAIIGEGRPVCVRSDTRVPCDCGEASGDLQPEVMLGVPVKLKDRVLGILYLADKSPGGRFNERDEALLRMLSAQAAVVIDKARIHDERVEAIRELEAARAVRARLSAYVNHDIRNALQGVALWAERLNERVADIELGSGVAAMAERIDRGTAHALRLVRDVLDLAALEEGRLETWPRAFFVADLLASAVEMVALDADRAEMRLQVESREGLTLVADPDRVRQIVVNLLHNAVKFAPDGSTVRVVAEARDRRAVDGPWVAIEVEDEGPGIAPEQVEMIFAAYERGQPGRRGSAGTGLGLTISRFLADHMGGSLTVETAVGRGATFTLWLPANREPEERVGWIG